MTAEQAFAALAYFRKRNRAVIRLRALHLSYKDWIELYAMCNRMIREHGFGFQLKIEDPCKPHFRFRGVNIYWTW